MRSLPLLALLTASTVAGAQESTDTPAPESQELVATTTAAPLGTRRSFGIGTAVSVGVSTGGGVALELLPLELRFFDGQGRNSFDLQVDWFSTVSQAQAGLGTLFSVTGMYHLRFPMNDAIGFAVAPGVNLVAGSASGVFAWGAVATSRVGVDLKVGTGPMELGLYIKPQVGVVGAGDFAGLFGAAYLETSFIWHTMK